MDVCTQDHLHFHTHMFTHTCKTLSFTHILNTFCIGKMFPFKNYFNWNANCVSKLLKLENLLCWKKICVEKVFILKNYLHVEVFFILKKL